jgi:hypothetical protein
MPYKSITIDASGLGFAVKDVLNAHFFARFFSVLKWEAFYKIVHAENARLFGKAMLTLK